jgi:hypothetical protein
MEFTQDDLFEAIDKAVAKTLTDGSLSGPPVDALTLAEAVFGLRIEYEEPEEPRKYGDRPKRRPGPNTIMLKEDHSIESQHLLAARAVGKQLLPGIFNRLGIVPDTENRSANAQLLGLIVPRLLLPSRWFASHARQAGFDLLELKEQYSTASFDLIAWRLLDADEDGSVVAIIDDGTVVGRRSNRYPVTKKLTPAEQACVDHVAAEGEACRKRSDGWTAWGWPTTGIPFRRIVVRAVPDEI